MKVTRIGGWVFTAAKMMLQAFVFGYMLSSMVVNPDFITAIGIAQVVCDLRETVIDLISKIDCL